MANMAIEEYEKKVSVQWCDQVEMQWVEKEVQVCFDVICCVFFDCIEDFVANLAGLWVLWGDIVRLCELCYVDMD